MLHTYPVALLYREDVADRCATEFRTMLDPRLRGLVLAFAFESMLRDWPTPQVTSLYRTPAENAAAKAVSTTHVDGRAADFSIHAYSPEQAAAIVEWFNSWFGVSPQKTALIHDAGSGMHLHVQVPRAVVVGADQKETPA